MAPGFPPVILQVAAHATVNWPLAETDPLPTLAAMRRAHFEEAILRCHGNRLAAAQALGVGKTTLYRAVPVAPNSASAPAGLDAQITPTVP